MQQLILLLTWDSFFINFKVATHAVSLIDIIDFNFCGLFSVI